MSSEIRRSEEVNNVGPSTLCFTQGIYFMQPFSNIGNNSKFQIA